MTKPFVPDEMLEHVEDLLRHSRNPLAMRIEPQRRAARLVPARRQFFFLQEAQDLKETQDVLRAVRDLFCRNEGSGQAVIEGERQRAFHTRSRMKTPAPDSFVAGPEFGDQAAVHVRNPQGDAQSFEA